MTYLFICQVAEWPLATGLTDYLPTCSGEYSPFRTRAPPENKNVEYNSEADLEDRGGGGSRGH